MGIAAVSPILSGSKETGDLSRNGQVDLADVGHVSPVMRDGFCGALSGCDQD
jgi:hypothetical protein